MPSPVPRDFPDILQDVMVTILEVFSSGQDASLRFTARSRQVAPIGKGDLPLVNIWCPELRSDEARSSPRTNQREIAVFNIDLYTRGEQLPDDSDYIAADQAAVMRLEYLRAQVKFALYHLEAADLGYPPGVIARKRWPSWQMFQTDNRMPAEAIVGGRLTLEIEYDWQPGDITGIALDTVSVSDSTKAMWDALFRPGGAT